MRAPHVLSGHAFEVKIRTCITLVRRSEARLLVTAAVEWTDKSDFKQTVEGAVFEGLKQYRQDIAALAQQDIDAYKKVSSELELSREECYQLNFTCPDAYEEYPGGSNKVSRRFIPPIITSTLSMRSKA